MFTGERMCSLVVGRGRSVNVREGTSPSEDHLKLLQVRVDKLEIEANLWDQACGRIHWKGKRG